VRQSYDHTFVGDQVFDGDLAFVRNQLGQARGGIFVLNREQLVFNNGQHALFFGQDIQQVFDAFEQLPVFSPNLIDFKAGQLIKAQFKNGVSLGFTEGITAAR